MKDYLKLFGIILAVFIAAFLCAGAKVGLWNFWVTMTALAIVGVMLIISMIFVYRFITKDW